MQFSRRSTSPEAQKPTSQKKKLREWIFHKKPQKTKCHNCIPIQMCFHLEHVLKQQVLCFFFRPTPRVQPKRGLKPKKRMTRWGGIYLWLAMSCRRGVFGSGFSCLKMGWRGEEVLYIYICGTYRFTYRISKYIMYIYIILYIYILHIHCTYIPGSCFCTPPKGQNSYAKQGSFGLPGIYMYMSNSLRQISKIRAFLAFLTPRMPWYSI